MSWPVLPRALVIFVFASLAFARPPPTSKNDPLYDVAKLAPKPPEPPICCLVPVPSNEPAEEILSFEDWKAKQLLVQGEGREPPKPPFNVNAQDPLLDTPNTELSAPPQTSQHEHSGPSRLRVPIVDRFNYANLDCSARVHNSHRSSKSPSSILSSKKDRYMLSPCNTPGEDKYVVIELCEDISIDTVQLANFEFFSGIFKEFTVKVAKTLASDDSWTFAGKYTAKNIRGIQTFHLPTSVRDFYRFVRIEFNSNYGNEFYCPVSLLRVFGLTHLEQYKWEEWEAESRVSRKGEVEENVALSARESEVANRIEVQSQQEETVVSEEKGSEHATATTSVPVSNISDNASELHANDCTSEVSNAETTFSNSRQLSDIPMPIPDSASSTTTTTISSVGTETSKVEQEPSASLDKPPPHDPSMEVESAASSPSHIPLSSSASDNNASAKTSISTPLPTTESAVNSMPIVVPHLSHSVPAVTSAGESIYRTIMTRLSSLETNSTLYLRYVEEQSRSLREALRRLEEDVGRLEGIGKAQSQFFQRTMQDWDKQRKRLEREHGELLSRVNFLSDEVVLEKRLGIAQLCLLLIVLLFMFITRGSRGEALMEAMKSERHSSLREWGRRQLSNFSSGEWNSKPYTRSSSQPITAQREVLGSKPTPHEEDAGGRRVTKLRSRDKFQLANPPTSPAKHRSAAGVRSPGPRQTVFHRPRTPVTPRTFGTPAVAPASTTQKPFLRRTSSYNSPTLTLSYSAGSSPLSTRKWAKTSHLHEVRRTPKQTLGSPRDENAEAPSFQKFLSPDSAKSMTEERGESLLVNRLKSQLTPTGDIFSSGVEGDSYMDRGVTIAADDWNVDGSDNRKPLSALENRHNDHSSGRILLGPPWQHRPTQSEGDAESEIWIDTDLESEAGE
ncbi:hypothetical protein SCHPADRAFT_880858 [Schizopora paradoxa]|uniref:SUN domain-containing protein n=1 Tax=Schizopora paradoxa TaxID=27342 RepID=A0A0H2RF10_9AGAM|nr:hypothetical protein SCHPADRAFT_880858 [Schizopora paradoxa]